MVVTIHRPYYLRLQAHENQIIAIRLITNDAHGDSMNKIVFIELINSDLLLEEKPQNVLK